MCVRVTAIRGEALGILMRHMLDGKLIDPICDSRSFLAFVADNCQALLYTVRAFSPGSLPNNRRLGDAHMDP